MKKVTRNSFSLRRRHLMIAGLAGVATPAALFAAQCNGIARSAPAVAGFAAGGAEAGGKMVVSGRILGVDCKPLADAAVTAWHDGANPDSAASVTTDADGRFVFTTAAPAGYPSLAPYINYRVSRGGHEVLSTQLYFANGRNVSDSRTAQLQRDAAGTWRATFGLTLV